MLFENWEVSVQMIVCYALLDFLICLFLGMEEPVHAYRDQIFNEIS